MRQILNPAWIEAIKKQIHTTPGFEHTNSFNLAIQWLVSYLDAQNIPSKVINLGAGVKKVTTKMDTCPKCNGTGRI